VRELSVPDLVAAMRDLQDRFHLDTVAVSSPTDLGLVTLTLTRGAPLVIEDDKGHSMAVEL
jgi:hypothetical protein